MKQWISSAFFVDQLYYLILYLNSLQRFFCREVSGDIVLLCVLRRAKPGVIHFIVHIPDALKRRIDGTLQPLIHFSPRAVVGFNHRVVFGQFFMLLFGRHLFAGFPVGNNPITVKGLLGS